MVSLSRIEPSTVLTNGDRLIEQIALSKYASVWRAQSEDESYCIYKIANPIADSHEPANGLGTDISGLMHSRAMLTETGNVLSVNVDSRSLLRNEFQFLHAAQGLGVVKAHDIFDFDGLLCLKRDYIDNAVTLRETMNQGAATLQHVQSLLINIACLEEFRLRHGDIKPENILLSNGQLWLIDCGFFGEIVTSSGVKEEVAFTTPAYYPWLEANDLWAVGAILWEIVTGRHPLESTTKSETHRESYLPLSSKMNLCMKGANSSGRPFLAALSNLAVPSKISELPHSRQIVDLLLRALSLQIKDHHLDLAEPFANSLEFQSVVRQLEALLEHVYIRDRI
jgi:serine/threonine protein kinase